MSKKPIGIFLTDTHKHKDNLGLVYDIFIQVLDLCDELGCKIVFHGGDFFTDRVGQNLQNLLCLHRIIKEFEKRGVIMYAIAGNHDKTHQDNEDSYLSIFKSKNFKLFKKETIEDINGVKFGFLPYFSTSMDERISSLNTEIKKGEKSILITHASFNGVMNNDGTEVSDGLSVKSVKKWSKVLVGHYHNSSFIEPNIFYTGSAYQSNFGENYHDKGFTVIYPDLSLDFVESKFKRFIKVNLTPNDDIEDEIDHYSKLDANVRFVFKGTKSDFSKIDVKKLDDFGIDSKFEWDEINQEILNSTSENFGSMSMKNITKYFMEYCEITDIPKDKRGFGLKLIKN